MGLSVESSDAKVSSYDLNQPTIIVVGNEGGGMRKAVSSCCTHLAHIQVSKSQHFRNLLLLLLFPLVHTFHSFKVFDEYICTQSYASQNFYSVGCVSCFLSVVALYLEKYLLSTIPSCVGQDAEGIKRITRFLECNKCSRNLSAPTDQINKNKKSLSLSHEGVFWQSQEGRPTRLKASFTCSKTEAENFYSQIFEFLGGGKTPNCHS